MYENCLFCGKIFGISFSRIAGITGSFCSFQVTSTENGIIFGNIVYDCGGVSSDRNVVVLNDIHIDIMDYIVPATCTETEFRQMWAEFEWENKVKFKSFDLDPINLQLARFIFRSL